MSLTSSFAFVRYPPPDRTPSNAANDYYVNPAAAHKVVESLRRSGVRTFLLIAASPLECRTIGAAIQSAGLEFFTGECWPWKSAIDEHGYLDVNKYIQNRIEPELIPLKKTSPMRSPASTSWTNPAWPSLMHSAPYVVRARITSSMT